jgi:sulfur carrier protein ThiS
VNVTVKLYAMLSEYLPAEVRGSNAMPLQVGESATVGQVIDKLKLPSRLTHLVLVNGHYVPPGERSQRILHEGDVLAIWPPVAGG